MRNNNKFTIDDKQKLIEQLKNVISFLKSEIEARSQIIINQNKDISNLKSEIVLFENCIQITKQSLKKEK